METKKKIYTTLAGFTLIAAALIVFFIWPSLMEIKKNSNDLLSGKNNIAFLGAQANEIENFQKNYENYKPNLEKMDRLFIDSKDPVDFIKFLENTASALRIKSEISLSSPSKEKNQTFVVFQLFSSGDFLKILEFLEKLEAGPYLIEIQNLTIRNSEEKSNSKNIPSEKVDVSFLIKAFVKQ